MLEHRWELSPAEAIALQRRLAAQVDLSAPVDFETLRLVAGVDVAQDGALPVLAEEVLRIFVAAHGL